MLRLLRVDDRKERRVPEDVGKNGRSILLDFLKLLNVRAAGAHPSWLRSVAHHQGAGNRMLLSLGWYPAMHLHRWLMWRVTRTMTKIRPCHPNVTALKLLPALDSANAASKRGLDIRKYTVTCGCISAAHHQSPSRRHLPESLAPVRGVSSTHCSCHRRHTALVPSRVPV